MAKRRPTSAVRAATPTHPAHSRAYVLLSAAVDALIALAEENLIVVYDEHGNESDISNRAHWISFTVEMCQRAMEGELSFEHEPRALALGKACLKHLPKLYRSRTQEAIKMFRAR